MHSALKRNGRPLYELASQGIEVERNRVRSQFTPSIPWIFWRLPDPSRCLQQGNLHSCSGGRYWSGAWLWRSFEALRRTVVGDLDLANAVTLAELEALTRASEQGVCSRSMPCCSVCRWLTVEGEAAERFSHGNPIEFA
jgi:tRNA pseudouridine55 synthase